MKKYMMMWLVLLPLLVNAQSPSRYKSDRSLISSLEIGASTYNTKVFEIAALIGLKDNDENSTLEVGYVFKRILEGGIGHNPTYHGLRGAVETPLIASFGVYGTYDVIKGERWLYRDIFGSELKMHTKIHGEGVLGVFFAPENSFLKFYVGLEPFHYDPLKVPRGLTPNKSSSINVKIKHTIDLSLK